MGTQVRRTWSTFAIGTMPDPSDVLSASTIIARHWIVQTNPSRIARLVDVVERHLYKLPLQNASLGMFTIVVSELIQNAFLHSPTGMRAFIEVSLLYVPTVGVFVGVSDTLGPIPRAVLSSDIGQVDTLAEHGRGFPLMRALSSFLSYSQHGRRKEIILGLSQVA